MKSAKRIFSAKKIVLVLSDASGYDLRSEKVDGQQPVVKKNHEGYVESEKFQAAIYVLFFVRESVCIMCVYMIYMFVFMYINVSKVKTTIPCHTMP